MAKKVNLNNDTVPTNVRTNEEEYAKLQYSLVLNYYILDLLGCDEFEALTKELKDPSLEGYDENNVSFFHKELVARLNTSKISEEEFLCYDQHIYRHTEHINEKRNEPIRWKYFQYLGLLFTEIYLDRYFSNKEALLTDLNRYLTEKFNKRNDTYHQIEPYKPSDLNKVAFWNATGSGKTLLMHINILQYIDYAEEAGVKFNRILLVTPNEGLSRQHLTELKQSNFSVGIFQKNGGTLYSGKHVELIEVSKLAEKDGDKTVAVDSFESNNLVLIDEGHRGSSGDVWKQMRERLSEKGFSFEYSATFGQSISSLNGTAKKKMLDEYAKATLMDYSYRYFYNDGYGKDYEILNLNDDWNEHTLTIYLTACLLNFYEQQKLFKQKEEVMEQFLLEKPLAIFVGSSVTAVRTEQKREVSDVVTILKFFSNFIGNPEVSKANIKRLMTGTDGLIDKQNHPIFRHSFTYLHQLDMTTEVLYKDMLQLLFNSTVPGAQLHLDNLKNVDGEIGMRMGNDDYFGVINVGDTSKLIKLCSANHISTNDMDFAGKSLFGSINQPHSTINVLIGSKKFTEGWSSWRVSTMGLMNIGRSEGSEIIQLFGRGVRLKGYNYSLKRSSELDSSIRPESIPQYIGLLEKLNIFGIRADYMEQFKEYLKEEGLPTNDSEYEEFNFPIMPTVNLSDKKLKYIRVKEGKDFKKEVVVNIMRNDKLPAIYKIKRGEVKLDYYPKIQILKSKQTTVSALTDTLNVEKLTPKHLAWLDWDKIYFKIQRYKNEKSWYNMTFNRDELNAIMLDSSWYELAIPKEEMEGQDFKYSVNLWENITISLLCLYIDRLYNKYKAGWTSEHLETAYLDASHPNFEQRYRVLVHQDLENIITNLKKLRENIDTNSFAANFQVAMNFEALYFSQHLYQPLLYLGDDYINSDGVKMVEIKPVPLNKGERNLVEDIKKFFINNEEYFEDKQLYLLRNQSRKGIGFFEANNFYPDFILWLVKGRKQYVTFIDPKGIRNLAGISDPKIRLAQIIKTDIESRLNDSMVKLNSFIISNTPLDSVKWWKLEHPSNDAKEQLDMFNKEHVLFQEEQKESYVKIMLEEIQK